MGGESDKVKNFENQGKIIGSDFEVKDHYFLNVSKSICKIRTSIQYGSGFLLKYLIDDHYFYCLVSNEHIITNNLIKKRDNIFVYYDSEFKNLQINLNEKERYIRTFNENDFDIAVIQILPKDNIEKLYFLLPLVIEDENFTKFQKKEIYMPQYPKGKKLKNAKGIILEINKYDIIHTANTEEGSSGSPIFLKSTNKVIGIHKSIEKNGKFIQKKFACFIYPVLSIIKEDIKKLYSHNKKIDKIEKKIDYGNGEYYIGEVKNNLRHGKGKLYYKNKDIQYEGDFVNNKFDGNGIFFYEHGEYYVGQFKNGKIDGEGKIYYPNGKIKFDCFFIDGRPIKGKYYDKDGNLLNEIL